MSDTEPGEPAPRRRSIRRRLLLLALLPPGLVLPLLTVLLMQWGSAYVDRLLIAKAASDLIVANSYFERVSSGIGSSLESLAASTRLARHYAGGRNSGHLPLWLDNERERLHLDFLLILSPDGCVLTPQLAPAGRKTCFPDWPVIEGARAGDGGSAVDVFPAELLRAIDPRLAARAHTTLIPTRNAAPDSRQVEERGLVVHAAAPMFDADGHIVAVLAGGVLLNGNLPFVDRLNEIVYPDGTLPLGSSGTATLFLGDVRIATNVRLFEDKRAIGTRVSQAVRDAVLGQGQTWHNRAFVVSDWYLSGYRPLLDSRGERVGMLYVGFLDKPFAAAKETAMVVVIGIFAAVMLFAAVFAVLLARRVFKPIERMHATMTAIESGHPDARVGPVGGHDEISDLASHFDRLLERQQAQAQSLQRWGESLDSEVARRTGELRQALSNLRAAQGKLVMHEKMAAIGQLTAGVAHEINNPIAVIQGNLELARELLGEQARPVEGELQLIVDQVHRIRLIVAKLLQFARPQEFVGYIEPVSPQALIQDCLLLVGHLLKKGNIAIEQRLHSVRRVNCNKNELQQVLINLMVNAIQVMPEGGVLTLSTEDWDEADMPIGLKLVVSDTGPGVPPENQTSIFEPFFTAHKIDGHGLGLWVSQSLVERYDGRITLDSPPGQGATFSVWMRCEPLG